MPYLYNRKKWTGWDLNLRPQQLAGSIKILWNKKNKYYEPYLNARYSI